MRSAGAKRNLRAMYRPGKLMCESGTVPVVACQNRPRLIHVGNADRPKLDSLGSTALATRDALAAMIFGLLIGIQIAIAKPPSL